MNTILKSYKFRVYPNREQANKLDQTFGCARFVWNRLVENFNNHGTDKYIEKLNETKIKKEHSFLYEVSAAAMCSKRRDFYDTTGQYFNKNRKSKIEKPKFKSKRSRQSYKLNNQKFKLNKKDNTVRIEKIGNVRVAIDREIPDEADYRSITVSKTPSGKYFVSILVRIEVEKIPLSNRHVGIDLGIKDLFILSNGDAVSNPKWFRENQTKLSKCKKHMQRKKQGSKRYEKQRRKLSKIHDKIVNSRNYFIHNFTKIIISNFDVICVEDLDIKGMGSTGLSKSIYDAGWYEFRRQLQYKCEWYGKTFVKIDRFYPSTQICSKCGNNGGKKDLSVRNWQCNYCGTTHDRDFNAALNILNKGYSDLTGLNLEETSAELVDYKRGEDVGLSDFIHHHLATSVKRLDFLVKTKAHGSVLSEQ